MRCENDDEDCVRKEREAVGDMMKLKSISLQITKSSSEQLGMINFTEIKADSQIHHMDFLTMVIMIAAETYDKGRSHNNIEKKTKIEKIGEGLKQFEVKWTDGSDSRISRTNRRTIIQDIAKLLIDDADGRRRQESYLQLQVVFLCHDKDVTLIEHDDTE